MATVSRPHTLAVHSTRAFSATQEETEGVGMEEDVRVLEVADPGKQVNPHPSPHALQP